ncbi:MAG: peptidoglycan-binding protein, partial [Patescibacteria group bacterium]
MDVFNIFLILSVFFVNLLSPVNFNVNARSAIIAPNGGECLATSEPFGILVNFDSHHIALYYRTDGRTPTHLDASKIKSLLTTKIFEWVPQKRHVSENGRVWIEELDENNETLGWYSSRANFAVRNSCPKVDTITPTITALEEKASKLGSFQLKISEVGKKLENSGSLTEKNLLDLLVKLFELRDEANKFFSPVKKIPPQLGFITKTLIPGMKDEEVKIMQEILSRFPEIYKDAVVDGFFSSSTEEALKQFQSIFKVDATEKEIVGPFTKFKLNSLRNSRVHVITKDSEGGFNPAKLFISVGDVVRWFNNSIEDSWPASDPHPIHNEYPETGGCIGSLFDACRLLRQRESYYFIFYVPGTWNYHDHLNPKSKGQI